MAVVLNAKGTSVPSFQIGKQGPIVKNDTDVVAIRNKNDDADASLTADSISLGVATGGDQGSGSLNAEALYVNGVEVGPSEAAFDLAAITGIIETNSTFVDFQIFGPALDPVKDWHIKHGASVATELMLVTVEDATADTDVTIWDLTDNTLIGGSPIATVTLTGAATVTSVAAAMGYIIVGSEDGVSIIDPHDGAWAERTVGWPKSLTASTTPALNVNDVVRVAAGFSDTPRYDPKTNGPMPSFAVGYGSGTPNNSLIKDDGNVWDSQIASTPCDGIAFINGRIAFTRLTDRVSGTPPISRIVSDATHSVSDNIIYSAGVDFGNYPDTQIKYSNNILAGASTTGLGLTWGVGFTDIKTELNVRINRARNTGWLIGDVRGAWLANSKTIDYTYKSNTLTENGTVPTAAVETGAELTAYGPFTAANNFSRALDADFQITTGVVCMKGWFKSSGTSTIETLCSWSSTNPNIDRYKMRIDASGLPSGQFRGASSTRTVAGTAAVDDGNWHMFVVFGSDNSTHDPLGTNFCFLYVDGVLVGEAVGPGTDFTGDAGSTWTIGIDGDGTDEEALTTQLALIRLTTSEPTDAQIRHMYETERRMFEANAKCLLQSGTTDAVLDVQIDPITNKVSVTQTDDEVTFDGLVIADEPTIPSGGTTWEHTARYGDDRFVITDANLYADIAAKDLRKELEDLRGKQLPKGPDLGRAKAWATTGSAGTSFNASYGFASVSKDANGVYDYVFAIPMKNTHYAVVANNTGTDATCVILNSAKTVNGFSVTTVEAGTNTNAIHSVVVYGELENE